MKDDERPSNPDDYSFNRMSDYLSLSSEEVPGLGVGSVLCNFLMIVSTLYMRSFHFISEVTSRIKGI